MNSRNEPKTFTINFTNGRKIRICGEAIDSSSDGVVVLRNGVDTYNFFRENVLYWSVSDGDGCPDKTDERPGLTERQLQILELMARGKTNTSIAREIGYSESTVRHESMAIYRALGVASRQEAVRVATVDSLIGIR